jgi:hypothetical protein
VRIAVMKHELSKMDFELIEESLKPLLYSDPDWAVAQKIVDLLVALGF